MTFPALLLWGVVFWLLTVWGLILLIGVAA